VKSGVVLMYRMINGGVMIARRDESAHRLRLSVIQ